MCIHMAVVTPNSCRRNWYVHVPIMCNIVHSIIYIIASYLSHIIIALIQCTVSKHICMFHKYNPYSVHVPDTYIKHVVNMHAQHLHAYNTVIATDS